MYAYIIHTMSEVVGKTWYLLLPVVIVQWKRISLVKHKYKDNISTQTGCYVIEQVAFLSFRQCL